MTTRTMRGFGLLAVSAGIAGAGIAGGCSSSLPDGFAEPGADGGSDSGPAAMGRDSGGGNDSGGATDSGSGTDAGKGSDAGKGTDSGKVDAGTDSGNEADSGTDSGSGADSGDDAGSDSGSDSGTDSGDAVDAGHDAGSDSGTDSGIGADSGGDSGPGTDSGSDAGLDSGTKVTFGASCPTATVYSEPLTSDPIADGVFTSLIGPSTYNSASDTISLGTGTPNTQLWIGPRPSWANYTISVPVRIDTANGNGGLNFRMESTPTNPPNDSGQMYFAGLTPALVQLGIENNGWNQIASQAGTFAQGTFYTLQVTAQGSSISVSVDGTAYITNHTDTTFTFGSFGLRTYNSGMTFGAITVTCQ